MDQPGVHDARTADGASIAYQAFGGEHELKGVADRWWLDRVTR